MAEYTPFQGRCRRHEMGLSMVLSAGSRRGIGFKTRLLKIFAQKRFYSLLAEDCLYHVRRCQNFSHSLYYTHTPCPSRQRSHFLSLYGI